MLDALKRRRKQKQSLPVKGMLLFVAITVAIIAGLYGAVVILNSQFKDRNQHVEVTFVEPHTAIIFWNTQKETVGYVQYGELENARDKTVHQTSSEPGLTHVVILEDVPLEGYRVSLHNESDPPFLFSEILDVVFVPEEFIE